MNYDHRYTKRIQGPRPVHPLAQFTADMALFIVLVAGLFSAWLFLAVTV